MRLQTRRKSAGVAIVTAIFLLVVVAGLAVAVISLSSAQQDASAKDLQGQRAYQAAKAGIEWALMQWQPTSRPTGPIACGTVTSFVPQAATLATFTVTVVITCDGDTQNGLVGGGTGDPTANHFVITSTACSQPAGNGCPNPVAGPDYVQRQLRAQL
ncbi:agglutinin biogenesis protein MshP [Duganella sp. sic0402]|uniref:agglutinin biogenesis protein MshP n=1 Tax=Duganella sp. sic0402 TaxID=2854786 RepID=UPI001C439A4E|nr:agglutinin biogenesis protein MshP [Duganella sp. sic0402]MBV7534385.1 agglutinin biogenesis protein MshP [Duganella sp. sic0402]